jgi:ferredoxin-NADP reductase
VSRWLHDQVKLGEHMRIEAPGGTFGFTGQEAASVAFIGGGVGITPMMSMARYLTDTGWPRTIYMVLGFHSPKDYIFRREIEEMQSRYPLLRVVTTIRDTQDEGWSGPTGHINAKLLRAKVPDIALHRVYLCGSPRMMTGVRAALEALGVPVAQVKTEAF